MPDPIVIRLQVPRDVATAIEQDPERFMEILTRLFEQEWEAFLTRCEGSYSAGSEEAYRGES